MRAVSRIARAVREPVRTAWWLRARLDARGLLNRHVTLARRLGLDRPVFLLSFDCDTVLDIEVADKVDSRLRALGITPVYAVPGQLLERGAPVWRSIAARGAEFINHGYYEHSVFDFEHRRYVSTLFYDRSDAETIRDDVVRGGEAIRAVLGSDPTGFRAPHFPTYQLPGQLNHMHRLLAELGYSYSSSAMPYHGLRRGLVWQTHGLFEIALSGAPSRPLELLDSWGHRIAPGRRHDEQDFMRGVAAWRTLAAQGMPCLINIYADPSHVADWDGFFEAAAQLAPWNILSYKSLLQNIGCC
jgi:peptidoglycan/xylan/chitin deacetylase (PgdA/CDA1 family)